MSFIAIFLFHTVSITEAPFFLSDFIQYLFKNLPLAIDVFFILSSFLLTWLGLNEYEKRHNFSFKNYFTRRILRIWPLYFFILFLAFVVFSVLAKMFHFNMSLPNAWYYIFFVANFYPYEHVFFLKFLWTISVEEQFYLLWGLCLRFFYKKLVLAVAILMITSIAFSVYAISAQVESYFNTLTYFFDFCCGALAAIWVFRRSVLLNWLRDLSGLGKIIFYSYLVFHFIIFYFLSRHFSGISNDFAALISRYFFIIYIALFIAEQMINQRRTKIFETNQFLIFTGKLSYGLYCFHGITITFINLLLAKFAISNWIMVIIYFSINYLIASISYFYLETPFLKLKSKWRRV